MGAYGGMEAMPSLTCPKPNEPPTACFTWQALSSAGTRLVVEPRVGDRIRFNASSSSDHNGEIVQYAWDWDSDGSYDTITTEPLIEHTFSTAGSHRVTLRVTDDEGAMATIMKAIAIGAKQPPNVSFTFLPSQPSVLDRVTFSDTSTDPNGDIVSWHWDFGGGATSDERNPTHRYEREGTFTVELAVTDNDGLTNEISQTIVVEHKDLIQADFTFQVVDETLHKVHLDASASIDTMGTIVRYEWDWDGDGVYDTAVQTPAMIHRFEGEGPYQVILTIVDDQGNRASCTKEVAP